MEAQEPGAKEVVERLLLQLTRGLGARGALANDGRELASAPHRLVVGHVREAPRHP